MKKLFLYIPVAILLLTLTSCSKEADKEIDDIIPGYLYGTWKITNGDTLTLSRLNGTNTATADLTFGPLRNRSNYPFTYRNEKLGIRGGLSSFRSGADYGFFDSFRWIQRGQSFEILRIEWFPLSSSTNTYYTFTKIP